MRNKNSKDEKHSFTRVYFESEEKRLRELKKKLEVYVKEMGGRNGVKNRPAHDAPKPFVDNVEKQIHFELQQAVAKTEAIIHQAYNGERNRKKSVAPTPYSKLIKVSPAVDRAASVEAIKNQSALLGTKLEELNEKANLRKSQVEGLVAKMNCRPCKKSWVSDIPYIIAATVISCGEFPINVSALSAVSDTMPLILCYATAGFLSLVGAGVAHYLGKGIAWKIARSERAYDEKVKEGETKDQNGFFSKENVEIGGPLIVGIALLGMVFILRLEEKDWYLCFINVGLIGIAMLSSYYHTDTKPWRKEYDDQIRDLERIKKQRTSVHKKLVKLQNISARLELVSQEEEIKLQENQAMNNLGNIVLCLDEYHMRYEALYRYLIELYRNTNTNARLDSGVPLVGFWDEFDQAYLPELTFNSIINNQNQ